MSLVESEPDVPPLHKQAVVWVTAMFLGAIGFALAWVAWHLWADHVLLHSIVQFLSKPPGKP